MLGSSFCQLGVSNPEQRLAILLSFVLDYLFVENTL